MIDDYENYSDKHYKVREHINYNGSNSNPFYPIGDIYNYEILGLNNAPNNKPFNGVFDGNNKIISGLYLEEKDISYVGLFQFLGPQAEVKNLTLTFYYNLSGENYYVGGLAGYSSGIITNVNVYGIITGSKIVLSGIISGFQAQGEIDNVNIGGMIQANAGEEIGGVAGSAVDVKISNVTTNDVVYVGATLVNSQLDASAAVGGIVGRADKVEIDTAQNYFDISCTSDYCGGIVARGLSEMVLTNVDNYVNINSAADYVGGIAGFLNDATVTDAHNLADPVLIKKVQGVNFVAGLFGDLRNATVSTISNLAKIMCDNAYCAGIAGSALASDISDFSTTNDVVGTNDYIGGAIGYSHTLTLDDGDIDADVSGDNSIGGIVGHSDKELIITNVDKIGHVDAAGDYLGGAIGFVLDGIEMENVNINQDLTLFRINGSATSNYVSAGVGKIFNNQGSSGLFESVSIKGNVDGYKFVGGLAGAAYNQILVDTASVNVDVYSLIDYAGGYFGLANSQAHGQIIVQNSSISSINFIKAGNNLAGGACGKCEYNIILDTISTSVNVNATYGYIGGLGGHLVSTQVLNSQVYLNNGVTPKRVVAGAFGSYVGGLTGLMVNSSIVNSFSSNLTIDGLSEVRGGSAVGGIAGKMVNSTLSKVYSNVDSQLLASGTSVAGLVAQVDGGYVYDSYARGAASGNNSAGLISSAYNAAKIERCFSTGKPDNVNGGAIFFVSGATVNNVVWDMDSSLATSSAAGVGYSTTEMNSTNPYAGFDFINIWNLPDVGVYPSFL